MYDVVISEVGDPGGCLCYYFWLGLGEVGVNKKDRSLKIMERWVVLLFTLEKLLQDLKVMLYCLYFMHLRSYVTLLGEVLDAPRKWGNQFSTGC